MLQDRYPNAVYDHPSAPRDVANSNRKVAGQTVADIGIDRGTVTEGQVATVRGKTLANARRAAGITDSAVSPALALLDSRRRRER